MVAGAGLVLALAMGTAGEAHKPVLSPYTYNEHIYPILRDRCGGCHAPGGVAPMSLLTHADAAPWAESIRLELMSGGMPPWRSTEFPRAQSHRDGLTARELDMLLTWAAGGTPM